MLPKSIPKPIGRKSFPGSLNKSRNLNLKLSNKSIQKPILGFLKGKTPSEFLKERLIKTSLPEDKHTIFYGTKKNQKPITKKIYPKAFEKDTQLIQDKLNLLTELLESGHIKDVNRSQKAKAIIYNLELEIEHAISRGDSKHIKQIKERLISFMQQYFSNWKKVL